MVPSCRLRRGGPQEPLHRALHAGETFGLVIIYSRRGEILQTQLIFLCLEVDMSYQWVCNLIFFYCLKIYD